MHKQSHRGDPWYHSALSAWKPDEWTLGRLYSVVRVCVMLEEAGL